MLGWPEILLIFAVILLIFGPSKLPEMARALGTAMKEFRKAASDLEQEAKILESPFTASQIPKTTPTTLPPTARVESQRIETPIEAPSSEVDISAEGDDSTKLFEVAKMLNIETKGKSEKQLKDEVSEKIKGLGEKAEEV